jgi:hypothetical protein
MRINIHITYSAKRVEEARQKQTQELIDIQHTTELEEVDELLATATRSKDSMVMEDEEDPSPKKSLLKEEGSVSDILPL